MPPKRLTRKQREQRQDARRSGIKELTRSRPRIKPTNPSSSSSSSTTQYTPDQLLDQAQNAFETMAYDLCLKFCERVLENEPGHEGAMELVALVHLQREEVDEARRIFEVCIEQNPDSGASKYMYLGQMSFGEDAAQYLGKGIELLASELEEFAQHETEEENIIEAQESIASAFCSLAEVYLTDLCEVEDAQETCLVLMQKALEYDPNNVQALQTLASIHISMSEVDKARDYLYRSLELWWPSNNSSSNKMNDAQDGDGMALVTQEKEKGGADDNGDDDDEEDEDNVEEGVPFAPPYEARINVVKLLIELEDFDRALTVLDMLIAEDDTITQVWYLQGWTLYLKGDMASAHDSLQRAHGLYLENNVERAEMLQHIEELMKDLVQ
eukprot:m.36426 g.36426  ORF g.36426 m.36426 type:complete len:384 (+) comp6668_c0_seq4:106-1257(+)